MEKAIQKLDFISKENALKVTKDEALLELNYLMEEIESLKEATKKPKVSEVFKGLNLEEMFLEENLIKVAKIRKDRKYASSIVELYATIEQLMKRIYFDLMGKKYKSKKNTNIIVDIEEKLIGFITLSEEKTEELAKFRNYIIHYDFSLKATRIKYDIGGKSFYLLERLFIGAIEYIKGINLRV